MLPCLARPVENVGTSLPDLADTAEEAAPGEGADALVWAAAVVLLLRRTKAGSQGLGRPLGNG